MPLNKVKTGSNMYQGWVTHTHTHLGGECPHKCTYCYVNSLPFGRPERYKGALRIIENELSVRYGTGKTIFIEHCNDLFAAEVSQDFINRIIHHCNKWPENTYVFQTKNPARYLTMDSLFPDGTILGSTIETNREIPGISKAPSPKDRMLAMEKLEARKFLTLEPIMNFDVDILAAWIDRIRPEFINLGADSKNNTLPEPTIEKLEKFVSKLAEYGIELRQKHNLARLRPYRGCRHAHSSYQVNPDDLSVWCFGCKPPRQVS